VAGVWSVKAVVVVVSVGFEELIKAGLRTALYVPMLRNGELMGVLSVGRMSMEPFTEKEIQLVTDFAAEAAIALEITRREQQLREVQTELAHANRDSHELSG
jgi:GAF domain-containing protein